MLINLKKIKNTTHFLLAGFKKYKKRVLLITTLGFLSGLFASIGIGAVIPLFSLITTQPTEEINFISRIIENAFNFLNIPFTPLSLIFFIALLFILKGLVQFTAKYINNKILAQFGEETRNNLVDLTFRSSWPHLLEQKIGHLETILLRDVYISTSLFNLISSFILLFTSFSMYALVALAISANFTLLTIALGIILTLVLKPVFYKIKKLSEETAGIQKLSSHHISENIIGMKAVKSTASENAVIQKGKEYFKKLKEAEIKASFYRETGVSFIEPAAFIVITLLFAFSYKSPGFNIAAFAVVIFLIQKMFMFIQSMQTHIQDINQSIPYLKAVLEYRQDAIKNTETDSGKKNFSFNNSIKFDVVSFSYGPTREIVSGLTFSIKKGETIGLVGPSGTGKTTVVDLLLRLFTPQKGVILIDGEDIHNVGLKEWRKRIGYVPQDIFLINDTIKNNIRFYNESISEKDIIEAAEMANIYDTVIELPKKFDTVVGERGVKLSGGQKQRIVLARALARKPEILILDEATSAIDTESEKLIQQSIKDLKGKVTILIIAHRPSTVMNCDRLVVLEKGGILEEGPPEKLIENPQSYFYRMK